MAVIWYKRNKMGVMIYSINHDGKKVEIENSIYEGNCLGVEVAEVEYYEEIKYQLFSFWNDDKHLKNMLGLSKDYENNNIYKELGLIKIKLNTFYKDSIKIGTLFAKAKFNVEFYYDESK